MHSPAESFLEEQTSNESQAKTIIALDDLLRSYAKPNPKLPQVAHQSQDNANAAYQDYTLADLDRFADEMARIFASQGLVPEVRMSF